MRWRISVFRADGALLFAGQCRDRAEAQAAAQAARAMRADVVIYVRSPTGAVSEWR